MKISNYVEAGAALGLIQSERLYFKKEPSTQMVRDLVEYFTGVYETVKDRGRIVKDYYTILKGYEIPELIAIFETKEQSSEVIPTRSSATEEAEASQNL